MDFYKKSPKHDAGLFSMDFKCIVLFQYFSVFYAVGIVMVIMRHDFYDRFRTFFMMSQEDK